MSPETPHTTTSTSRMARRGLGTGPRSHARAIRSKLTPVRLAIGALIGLVLVLAVCGYILVRLQTEGRQRDTARAGTVASPLPAASIAASDGAEASGTASATGTAGGAQSANASAAVGFEVEVPDVVGRTLKEAELLLKSVGFTTLTRVAEPPVPGTPGDIVTAMAPPRGTRLKSGASVTITYNPRATVAAGQGSTQPGAQKIVVIDAGHQEHADLTLEPIGPGATEMKEKVRGGGTGVSTRVPEYQRTLEVSLKLRDKLAAAGVKVIMVRTTSNVNVANSERAKIGNRAGADLTIRVHFDSNEKSSVHGISTLYPSGNRWCTPIEPASKRAAGIVQACVVQATGASGRGIVGRSDMTGFNWSTVPTIIVENGFLSNPDEDRLVATAAYQDKIASGLAKGVLDYLGK